MSQNEAGAVLVISSHVIRGSVGNRSAVFALETMGHPVWAFPTIVMPWHPGHGRSTRLTFPEADFDRAIDDIIAARWLPEVKAVLSGYFANAAQARSVARLVTALREKNPDILYACDPIIGDSGGLYVPEPTAEAIRDHLIPLASLATPNRYELAWLSGAPLDDNNAVIDAALALGPARMLVTSAIPMMAGGIGNLYLSGRNALLAEHRSVEGAPNGLGDLLSAVFLSRLMSGIGEEKALQLATASVYEVLARAVKRGSDELTLSADAASLMTPMAMVQMRHLMHPAQRRRT
jgi:pyridoxine kinase